MSEGHVHVWVSTVVLDPRFPDRDDTFITVIECATCGATS